MSESMTLAEQATHAPAPTDETSVLVLVTKIAKPGAMGLPFVAHTHQDRRDPLNLESHGKTPGEALDNLVHFCRDRLDSRFLGTVLQETVDLFPDDKD